jgi:hypothetical protein
MGSRLRKRNRRGRGGVLLRAAAGNPRRNPAPRWAVSTPHGASHGAMPRAGAVLLAIVVVTLLTFGLHMLFQ